MDLSVICTQYWYFHSCVTVMGMTSEGTVCSAGFIMFTHHKVMRSWPALPQESKSKSHRLFMLQSHSIIKRLRVGGMTESFCNGMSNFQRDIYFSWNSKKRKGKKWYIQHLKVEDHQDFKNVQFWNIDSCEM